MSKTKRPCGLVDHPESAIGRAVLKFSGKPFKSRNKVNIVKAVVTNPNTGRPAFSFIEDDSIVDVCQCELSFLTNNGAMIQY